MKVCSIKLFNLTLILALIPSSIGTAAQRLTPNPTSYHRDVGIDLAYQQQSQNVRLVSQIGGPINAVAAQGNYAYIGIGPRLIILDVSDPALPAFVGQSAVLPGIVESIALLGDPLAGSGKFYAFVATG